MNEIMRLMWMFRYADSEHLGDVEAIIKARLREVLNTANSPEEELIASFYVLESDKILKIELGSTLTTMYANPGLYKLTREKK